MWEVYIIQSIKFLKYYIGYSHNVEYRLNYYHNRRLNRSTKPYIPYKLILIEKCKTKSEALKRERVLKRMKGGNEFKKLIKSA